MLKYCLEKWEQNNGVLEKTIRAKANFVNSCEYVDLVKLVVDCVLNYKEEYDYLDRDWDSGNITIVDNGDYQGTQLFLIPAKCYQPSEYEYLMTYVGYGSCSGCDTLQAIQSWGKDTLSETAVKDFMTLCKDLLTNMIKPYNGGWRFQEGFEEANNDD